MKQLLKCPTCSAYGFSETCSCGSTRGVSSPPKYSPHDKYAGMKRQAKEEAGHFVAVLKRLKRS